MSFQLNSIISNENYTERTQRIYIDPQRLISMKTKRKSFGMVPSIYQPPEDQLSFKNQQTWDKSTNHSFLKNQSGSILSKKNSKQLYPIPDEKQIHPQQKIKMLQQIMQGQNIAPNVQFIWKLLPPSFKKQIVNYQQGDCIPLPGLNEDKYLILSGQIRIIGVNQHQFKRKAGYLFFLSNQTQTKVKQLVVLSSTKILKIPNNIYQNVIKNYLFLKHSQKIKFIQYCPFFIWKNQLTQDLAACMDIKFTQKQEVIYQANTNPDAIYFVKEGIVLLQRNTKLLNPIMYDHQQHYQKNQISEKDTILVVRKGMAFGIDGIIIKQFSHPTFQNIQIEQTINKQQAHSSIMEKYSKQLQKVELDQQNPQAIHSTKSIPRRNQRVYTAKTLGKCQLYCLDKKILQTLFSVSDINEQMYIKRKQIIPDQLERMSIEYTNMILNNTHPNFVQIPVKKKQIILNVSNNNLQKIKPTTSFELNNFSSQKKITKSNNLLKGFQFKYKRFSSQQNIKLTSDAKGAIYLNEQRQRIELRNRISGERQKEKLMRIKKSKQIQTINLRKVNTQSYILPKIINSPRQNMIYNNNKISKQNRKKQKQRLDEIISIKLRQQLKNDNNIKQIKRKSQLIKIQPCITSQSQLSKLLVQNQTSKSNPSFFNIKSYKSIISVYQSAKHV